MAPVHNGVRDGGMRSESIRSEFVAYSYSSYALGMSICTLQDFVAHIHILNERVERFVCYKALLHLLTKFDERARQSSARHERDRHEPSVIIS